MVKRLKMMLRKEKGFTLVELLAVVAILAIVVAIAVPVVGNVVSESEDKAHLANIELIKNAARLADVSGDFDTTDNKMSVSELQGAGYLEKVPVDPKDDTKVYSGDITKDAENGTFSYNGNTSVPTP